jgi:SEC-C motif-containing protein
MVNPNPMTTPCYCGSNLSFDLCCKLYISGQAVAPTAEKLMRSRYSAYATHQADYLVATTHKAARTKSLKQDTLQWAIANQWQKLEILTVTATVVEFKAYYFDAYKNQHIHHERSTFVQEDGLWFYVDGTFYN